METETIDGGELANEFNISEPNKLNKYVFVKFSYESANGIKAQETGDVKNKGSENAIQSVQGRYSFTSPEGQFIEITYTGRYLFTTHHLHRQETTAIAFCFSLGTFYIIHTLKRSILSILFELEGFF